MRKLNIIQILYSYDEVGNIFSPSDFEEISISNLNKNLLSDLNNFCFYFDDNICYGVIDKDKLEIYRLVDYDYDKGSYQTYKLSLNSNEVIRPILTQYYIGDEQNKRLLYCIHQIVHRRCNCIDYAKSLEKCSEFLSTHTILIIGNISSTTFYNYKSLLKLIPVFLNSIRNGRINVYVGFLIARLTEFQQHNLFKSLTDKGFNIEKEAVDSKVVIALAYSIILCMTDTFAVFPRKQII